MVAADIDLLHQRNAIKRAMSHDSVWVWWTDWRTDAEFKKPNTGVRSTVNFQEGRGGQFWRSMASIWPDIDQNRYKRSRKCLNWEDWANLSLDDCRCYIWRYSNMLLILHSFRSVLCEGFGPKIATNNNVKLRQSPSNVVVDHGHF
jgi:hypothetical protein